MRLVITQSNYIPWRGYFDLIGRADLCLFYDTAQYTKQDWRNRNLIKTGGGTEWLTLPVAKGGTARRICDVMVVSGWAGKHVRRLEANYREAAGFAAMWPVLLELYRKVGSMPALSAVNHAMLAEICAVMGIRTRLEMAPVMPAQEDRTQALIALCRRYGATHYLVGPKAKAYLDEEAFAAAGITVEWMAYGPYAPYAQLHGAFAEHVSVVDALLNLGDGKAVLGAR